MIDGATSFDSVSSSFLDGPSLNLDEVSLGLKITILVAAVAIPILVASAFIVATCAVGNVGVFGQLNWSRKLGFGLYAVTGICVVFATTILVYIIWIKGKKGEGGLDLSPILNRTKSLSTVDQESDELYGNQWSQIMDALTMPEQGGDLATDLDQSFKIFKKTLSSILQIWSPNILVETIQSSENFDKLWSKILEKLTIAQNDSCKIDLNESIDGLKEIWSPIIETKKIDSFTDLDDSIKHMWTLLLSKVTEEKTYSTTTTAITSA